MAETHHVVISAIAYKLVKQTTEAYLNTHGVDIQYVNAKSIPLTT